MARSRPDRSNRQRGSVRQLPWREVVNRLPPIEILGPEQVETIHDASLRLLATTGMRVLEPGARDRFRRAGCTVDDDRVRFDPEMVMETIATAPASFGLRARDPAKSLVIGGNRVVFTAIGGPAFVADLDRGRRPGTYAEQCDFLRVVQSLDIVHQEGGGPFEAMDLPAETRHLDLLAALARLVDKNWQGIALGRERAVDSIPGPTGVIPSRLRSSGVRAASSTRRCAMTSR